MAESLSHKFGQIIGDLLEMAIIPSLKEFTDANNLYLDKKGKRLARTGTKVSWFDLKNNKHDLDYVIERNGSDGELGDPIAFIEIAWRRYTKHSRNKAQEIQGAIMPLVEKYHNLSPFKGVILAGNFTNGSLDQLTSNGFNVLYFPYN
ncbi:MAG: DNA methylase, partial [Pedobacter sp.]